MKCVKYVVPFKRDGSSWACGSASLPTPESCPSVSILSILQIPTICSIILVQLLKLVRTTKLIHRSTITTPYVTEPIKDPPPLCGWGSVPAQWPMFDFAVGGGDATDIYKFISLYILLTPGASRWIYSCYSPSQWVLLIIKKKRKSFISVMFVGSELHHCVCMYVCMFMWLYLQSTPDVSRTSAKTQERRRTNKLPGSSLCPLLGRPR